MVTIEETIISPMQQRAIDYCDKKQMPKIGRQIAVIAYMHGAQEERERCIELWCKSCAAYGSGVCSPNGCSHKRRFMEYLRKAMEGGEG